MVEDDRLEGLDKQTKGWWSKMARSHSVDTGDTENGCNNIQVGISTCVVEDKS
jgi:hypothetical protein